LHDAVFTFGAPAFLAVIAFAGTTLLVRSREQWIVLCAVWTIIGTALVAWAYGVGTYWSVASFVGKLAANALVVLCMVVATSSGVVVARRADGGRAWQILGGLVGGLLGIPVSLVVGVLGACAFTGDCL
jgi:hypothetical protein